MSAAANAAGYLYAHRLLPGTAQPERNVAARNVAPRAAPQPDKQEQRQPRAPRIEYRKRRVLMREAA